MCVNQAFSPDSIPAILAAQSIFTAKSVTMTECAPSARINSSSTKDSAQNVPIRSITVLTVEKYLDKLSANYVRKITS